MTPVQAYLLADFSHQIQGRIKLIRENGHRPSPFDLEDYRDFELEDAYDAIRPMLICISKPQLYAGVASLPENQGSFVAENAHHAQSIQFNPPESMYGNPSLLEEDSIKHMLRQAAVERSRLAEMPTIPVAVPVLPRCGADIWNEDYVTEWRIPAPSTISVTPSTLVQHTTVPPDPLNYTLSETRWKLIEATDNEPRSIKELAKRSGCEYQTAKEYLPELKRSGHVRKVKQGYVRPQ